MRNLSMKIAIVCDWLTTLGGAEKVLAEILQCYPQADLFAVVDFMEPVHRSFLLNKQVKTTFIQKIPFAKKYYRQLLPLMPLAIEQLDLSSYDLILSSSHAVAKGVITGPQQVHISYIHSPMRYAWDLQHQYLRETQLDKKAHGYLARYCLHKLRLWDFQSAQRVDHLIANSQFIAKRIMKAYRREADVIYPPIDTALFTPGAEKEAFYITASRLVPYKRIDLIVDSFRHLPNKKLVVVGDGPEFSKIRAKASSNVSLLGYQTNAQLISLLQRAKAFIFAAEEDFGMLPVEAQACGTPVIAYGKGGALETVRGLEQAEPTGIFFAKQTIEAIQEGIKTFEANAACFTAQNCINNAARFDPRHFRQRLKEAIQSKIEN